MLLLARSACLGLCSDFGRVGEIVASSRFGSCTGLRGSGASDLPRRTADSVDSGACHLLVHLHKKTAADASVSY